MEQQALPDGQGVRRKRARRVHQARHWRATPWEQMAASYALANAVVLRTASDMLGTLLDEYA